jgi:hypothetical protein
MQSDAGIIEGVGERVKALIKDEIHARNQASKRRCNGLSLPNTVPEACWWGSDSFPYGYMGL